MRTVLSLSLSLQLSLPIYQFFLCFVIFPQNASNNHLQHFEDSASEIPHIHLQNYLRQIPPVSRPPQTLLRRRISSPRSSSSSTVQLHIRIIALIFSSSGIPQNSGFFFFFRGDDGNHLDIVERGFPPENIPITTRRTLFTRLLMCCSYGYLLSSRYSPGSHLPILLICFEF